MTSDRLSARQQQQAAAVRRCDWGGGGGDGGGGRRPREGGCGCRGGGLAVREACSPFRLGGGTILCSSIEPVLWASRLSACLISTLHLLQARRRTILTSYDGNSRSAAVFLCRLHKNCAASIRRPRRFPTGQRLGHTPSAHWM